MVDQMYTRFARAMRSNFSPERPAQPVLYLDATGASLGRGITHVEAGSADFDGTAKQSRSTLTPLALYEGSDKGAPLREHLPLVLTSWNKLIARGTLQQGDTCVPCRPITSADMQGTKALYGKGPASAPTWCTCAKGPDQQHKYCKETIEESVSGYDKMIEYIEGTVGCEIQGAEAMCRNAHYSYGVWKGGTFTPINCRCGYNPTEAEWRSDLTAFGEKSDAEQVEARKVHNEVGVNEPQWNGHDRQFLFMPPGVQNGMERAGVDNLHLIYLNVFKLLFLYTVHQNLPGQTPAAATHSPPPRSPPSAQPARPAPPLTVSHFARRLQEKDCAQLPQGFRLLLVRCRCR